MPLSAQAVIEHDLPTVALPIVALPCASRPTRQPRTVVPVIVTSPVGSHLDPDHTRAVLDDAVPEHGGAWRSMAEHGVVCEWGTLCPQTAASPSDQPVTLSMRRCWS